MEATVNIGTGKDEIGEFMQHSLNIGDTITPITKAYYKIVDEQLVKNMPQGVLEDLAKKAITELYNRADNTQKEWLGKYLNSLLNGCS